MIGKLNAAKAALEEIENNQIIGIGTGSTVAIFIKLLGEKIKKEKLKIKAIPTSYQSLYLAIENGIEITSLEEYPEIDLAIDGADEVDPNLNLIKGGGAALTREKIIDSSAKKFVVIIDESKFVKKLGEKSPLPIEVIPIAWKKIIKKIEEMGGNAKLRDGGDRKDGPIITDNGNFIIDARFNSIDKNLELKLKMIPGVVEVGLFMDMVDVVYIGNEKGFKKLTKLIR
ncbi:MAG: ribose 5-phosphate isomerase A [Candidatus Methanomethylicaceae archaeon]|nr:ribose 5-phosphate isomerase A [Candidatus Verstraetearchaeota archaeon]